MANTKLPARLLDTSAIPALNVTGDLTVSTTTLTVDSTNDRVGIGIASPGRTLHIKDSGQIKLESTSSGGWVGLDFAAGNGTYDGYMGMLDSNGRFFIDVDSNGDDLTILQNGNVGIGTDTPLGKLHVRDGSAQAGISHTYIYDGSAISVEGTEPAVQLMAEDSGTHGGSLLWRYGNNAFAAIANPTTDAIDFTYGVTTANDFQVHSGTNMSSYLKIMSIGANGNVGIGTDDPASGLHLKGGDNTSSKLTLTNSAPTPDNTWSLHPIYNGQDLYLAEDGTTRISFIAGGNVDVKSGNIYLTGNNDRRIKLSDSGVAGISDSNNTVHIRGDNDYMKLNAAGNGGFIWEENGTERMRIDSSGRVSVGTSLDADGASVIPAGVFHTKRYGYHAGQRTHSGETFTYCESTGWVDALKIDWNNPSWGAVCLRITGQYYYSASDNFSIVIAFAGHSGATSVSYDATSNGVMNWTSAIQLSQPATGETLIKQRAGSTTGDVVYRYEWQTFNRSDQEIDIIDY